MNPWRKFILSAFRRFGKKDLEVVVTTEATYMVEELMKINDKPINMNKYVNKMIYILSIHTLGCVNTTLTIDLLMIF